MDLYERIQSLAQDKGYKIGGLAKAAKISTSILYDLRDGRTQNLSRKTAEKVSAVLEVSVDELYGETSESTIFDVRGVLPVPKTVKRPLLGVISCGEPVLSDENFEGYYDVPEMFSKCDFILKCEGDSMTGARINNGDFVFIKQQTIVDNGQIAAVLVDGSEKLLKRVYISESSIVLQAENPAYPPLVFSKEEMNRVNIIGKAIGFASTIK